MCYNQYAILIDEHSHTTGHQIKDDFSFREMDDIELGTGDITLRKIQFFRLNFRLILGVGKFSSISNLRADQSLVMFRQYCITE